MNTIEMLSELEKFPQNKYVITDGIYEYFMSIKNGYLYFETYKSGVFCNASFNGNIKLSDKWELVKEPVTWQEAIQAWIEGKEIYIEFNEHTYNYKNRRFLTDLNGDAPSFDELKYGKWYIKN